MKALVHCSGTVSATGTIIDNNNPTVTSPSSCYWRNLMCVYFTLGPSAVDTSYTFVLTNGTAGSADYTTTNVMACTCWCNYWNCIGTNNCGYDWWNENFNCSGTVSATGTIIDNESPTVSLLLRLPKDLMYSFTLSNPSAVDTSYTLF
jgi:hypothetical protein